MRGFSGSTSATNPSPPPMMNQSSFAIPARLRTALGPPGRCVAVPASHVFYDSLAVQANGDVCVATILNGGITTITPQGATSHTAFPDPLVTNIAFGGADMRDAYITLSGTSQLIKTRWPEPGLKLNFGQY